MDSRINFQTLERLKELLNHGAKVSGMPPIGIQSEVKWTVKEQTAFDLMVKRMWSGLNGKIKYHKKYGKGELFWGKKNEEVIKEIQAIPDVILGNTKEVDQLYFIHKHLKTDDIYYLTNQEECTRSLNLSFRITDKIPEIWNPVTGETTRVKKTKVNKTHTSFDYEFAPYGSTFVVFREKNTTNANKCTKVQTKLTSSIALNQDWTITFTDKRQKIENPIRTNQLFLWNESTNEKIKYYSGTAIYRTAFDISQKDLNASSSIVLHLGEELYNIASITVNGQKLGSVWAKPFEREIRRALCSGKNCIEIQVANTWINRIIGDEAIPDDAEYETEGTKFTIGRASKIPEWIYEAKEMPSNRKRLTYATWTHYKLDSPLMKAGLEGPVQLKFYTDQ